MSAYLLPLALLLACTPLEPALAHSPTSPVSSGPYSLQLVDEAGSPLRSFFHRGRHYVLGGIGQRYLMRIQNNSSKRIEVVASVDGRDVVDGESANTQKRGYLVEPWGHLDIDGFRVSGQSVAAFRFSAVSSSYAAQRGNAREVGVIGVAVFPERSYPPVFSLGQHEAEEKHAAPSASAEVAAPPAAKADAAGASRSKMMERSGLGTQFGERHSSYVTEVAFERGASSPETLLTLRYNDRRGLMALGISVDPPRPAPDERWLRETAEPFPGNARYAKPPSGWN